MTRIERALVVALVLLLVACASRGVQRVPEGEYAAFVVVQASDRTRLAGATVRIGDQACRTQALGWCHLVLAPGIYPLRVGAEGYGEYVSAVEVVTDVMIRVPLQRGE